MKGYFKKKKKAVIRKYMRSYNLLIKEEKTELITQIKNLLADYPITEGSLQNNFKSSKNTCLHQFLVHRLLGIEFNKAILSSIIHPQKKIYYPLPWQWRKLLVEQGFTVPILTNQVLWFNFNIKWFLVGIASGFIELLGSLKRYRLKTGPSTVFFHNLYPGNLVHNDSKKSLNILEWFCDQEEASDIDSIYHSCKASLINKIEKKEVNYVRSPLTGINTLSKFIRFIIWFFLESLNALFVLKNRLIFRELVFEKLAKLCTKKELFSKYFFHNSGHILRPLWTYEAELKGSEIIFYFYSTNNSSFKVNNKPHIQENQWQVLNWPHYWVWHKEQIDFLKSNLLSRFNTTVKGVIPFEVSNKDFDFSQNKVKSYILVFDVQPYKNHFYSSLALSVDFYSEKNTIKFLDWINLLAIKYGINIVIKRKRYNDLVSKKYIRKINELKETQFWDEIDPSIDANHAIINLNPIATISMPFTSTASISKAHKIESIYLDPTGNLDKNFKINNNIPLLSSEEQLFRWYENKFKI